MNYLRRVSDRNTNHETNLSELGTYKDNTSTLVTSCLSNPSNRCRCLDRSASHYKLSCETEVTDPRLEEGTGR